MEFFSWYNTQKEMWLLKCGNYPLNLTEEINNKIIFQYFLKRRDICCHLSKSVCITNLDALPLDGIVKGINTCAVKINKRSFTQWVSERQKCMLNVKLSSNKYIQK